MDALTFAIKPLVCDPARLKGLSPRLIQSHYDNNYSGAVKRLNAVSAQLAALDYSTAPGFVINGLKREQLIAANSMLLHELYFSCLGEGDAPEAALERMMKESFGSYQRWRAEFVAMGKALAGGSGWVVLAFLSRDRRLVNQWAADHTHALAGAVPILALDMYEHSYHLDYGAKAGEYVDAFMRNVAWPAVSKRFEVLA